MVVGVIKEIEEIPHMPQLEDEVPLVGVMYKIGYVDPKPVDVFEPDELDFLYDVEHNHAEIARGEQQALALIEVFKV